MNAFKKTPQKTMQKALLTSALAAALAAGLIACGGPPGEAGTNGVDGNDGDQGIQGITGDSGTDGSDGNDGVDGVNGQDTTPHALIIDLRAEDALGSESDNALVATFAGDVSDNDAELATSDLVMTYSHRDALPFVESNSAGTSFTNVDGVRVLTLFADAPGDGFIQAGAGFGFAFPDGTNLGGAFAVESVIRIWRLLETQLGAPGGLSVSDFNNDGLYFEANRDLPIAQFNDADEPIGTMLTLPAFLFRDIFSGRSSEMGVFLLDDGATLDGYVEPTGTPFDVGEINDIGTLEDGKFDAGSTFILRFEQAMDQNSTEAAIERRLEQSALWNDVEVNALSLSAYQVSILGGEVDLTSVGNSFRLELTPWDVTDSEGIANSNESIIFNITDISVPVLQEFQEDDLGISTLLIGLTDGTPDRLGNHQLVAGDLLVFGFSELMETPATDIIDQFLTSMNAQFGLNALPARVTPFGSGFTFQLEGAETIDILGGTLAFATFSPSTVADANGTPVAPGQVPVAISSHWISAPTLVDQSGEDALGVTMNVVLGGTDREDNVLESGDTVQVIFSKTMDVPSTTTALADMLANGNTAGGTRGGVWNVASVVAGMGTFNGSRGFSYTLNGDQTLSISGSTLAFQAIAVTAKDVNGLRLEPGQIASISSDVFDPSVPPTLEEIVAFKIGSTPCGDGLLSEGDQVVFNFSEALDPAQQSNIAADIAAKLSTVAAGNINALAVSTLGNQTFTVTLPANVTLNVANDVNIILDVTNIVDPNGVQATTAIGTIAATDVLEVTMVLDDQNQPEDGQLVGGDSLTLSFSCQMDYFDTLSSIQEAADALFGDNMTRTNTTDYRNFRIRVLAGRVIDASAQLTLNVGAVVTDANPSADDDDRATIAGPFSMTFDDAAVDDVTFFYIAGSAQGNEGRFQAPAAVRSGEWHLSSVSPSLGRDEVDLKVVFGNFDAPPPVEEVP